MLTSNSSKSSASLASVVCNRLIPLLVVVAVQHFASCYAQDARPIEQRLVNLTADAISELSKFDRSLPAAVENTQIQAITYPSDGLRVKGYCVEPKNGELKRPCIIWNRGGNREFGALDDELAALFLAKIANWGYIVVAPQYRGNGGGEGAEQFGGADVNDVLNLIPLLEQHPSADASRIGMIGWSRGGLMTCLALTKTDRIKAAIIGSGMYDAHRAIADRPEMETEVISQLVPNYQQNKKAELDARSPVLWSERINKTTPILMLHGSLDDKVSPLEALNMAEVLVKNKHVVRLVLFESSGHRIHLDHGDEVDRLTQRWLEKHLN